MSCDKALPGPWKQSLIGLRLSDICCVKQECLNDVDERQLKNDILHIKTDIPIKKFEGPRDSVERLSMAVHKNAKAPD